MTINYLKFSFKSSSDIENLYDASSMQTSAKTAKALKFSEKNKQMQKKQKLQKNIANLIIIFNFVKIEMQNEQEYDILMTLHNQKETLHKILQQKQTK